MNYAPVRRLAGPTGLLLAGLCLLLPFLTASCASGEPPRVQWRVTYTGADVLTGGRPEVAFTEDADREPIHRLDDAEARGVLGTPPVPLPAQPVAWLAAALMVAALAATALPSRAWRRTGTAGLSLAAAIVLAGATMLARRDAADAVATVIRQSGTSSPIRRWDHYEQVSDTFRYGHGFWLAVAILAAVGIANTVAAARTES